MNARERSKPPDGFPLLEPFAAMGPNPFFYEEMGHLWGLPWGFDPTIAVANWKDGSESTVTTLRQCEP